MEEPLTTRWFATPDGGSLYALSGLDRLLEHQRIGSRHAVHELQATTFADRLRMSDLLEGAAAGRLLELTAEEYERRLVDMASTPRIG